MTLPGYFWDRWPYFAGNLSWDITTTQVNSALHPSGVAKSSTSFGWGKGGKVTSAGWHVTLCDLIWHVISRSGLLYFTLLYILWSTNNKGYFSTTGHWIDDDLARKSVALGCRLVTQQREDFGFWICEILCDCILISNTLLISNLFVRWFWFWLQITLQMIFPITDVYRVAISEFAH